MKRNGSVNNINKRKSTTLNTEVFHTTFMDYYSVKFTADTVCKNYHNLSTRQSTWKGAMEGKAKQGGGFRNISNTEQKKKNQDCAQGSA